MHALIADDDRGVTLVLSRALVQWGIDPVIASDGDAAWEAAQSDPRPSLAIIDWMMPGLDGPELCRRFRAHDDLQHLYVILLTSRSGHADLVAGLDAGADDYVVKPFDLEELRARVHVGLRVLELQERLARKVTELQSALSRVKQLHGLLPICSYCKRIRADENYWQQLESYVAEHSDAQFSHGVCPSCLEQVLANIENDDV